MAFTKLYLRNQAATAGITMPGTTAPLGAIWKNDSSPDIGSGTDYTNRDASTVIGSGHTSGVYTTGANTNAQNFTWRRFVSPLLAAGTYTNLNFTHSCARAESNLNSNFLLRCAIGTWNGTTYTAWHSDDTLSENTSAGTQQTFSETSSNVTLTVADGDVLVIEVGRQTSSQGMGTAYTNTYYYDGTTEASTTNCASFVSFSQTIAEPAVAERVPKSTPYPQLLAH